MCLWLVLPLKPFSSGKSRLSAHLSYEQRISLNKRLAEQTILMCRAVKEICHILIVSSGREMNRFASQVGIEFIQEPPGGINAALVTAASYAINHGADTLLILHSDLPSIRTTEIETLIHSSMGEKSIRIVSDHHKTGTNALLLKPPDCIPFLFGEGSYIRHINAAKSRNIDIQTLNLPSISFDLDTINDLEYALTKNLLPREWIEKL